MPYYWEESLIDQLNWYSTEIGYTNVQAALILLNHPIYYRVRAGTANKKKLFPFYITVEDKQFTTGIRYQPTSLKGLVKRIFRNVWVYISKENFHGNLKSHQR